MHSPSIVSSSQTKSKIKSKFRSRLPYRSLSASPLRDPSYTSSHAHLNVIVAPKSSSYHITQCRLERISRRKHLHTKAENLVWMELKKFEELIVDLRKELTQYLTRATTRHKALDKFEQWTIEEKHYNDPELDPDLFHVHGEELKKEVHDFVSTYSHINHIPFLF